MAATAERPRFNPQEDYLQTFDVIAREFAGNADAIFDTGEDVRVLAGVAAVTNSRLSHVDTALGAPGMARVTLIETRDPGTGDVHYRHDFRVFTSGYEQLGDPDTGFYHTSPRESDWEGRTVEQGERHRELVDGARFDLLEAQLIASDEVGVGSIEAGLQASNAAEALYAHARRTERAAKWLGPIGRFLFGRRSGPAGSA